MKVEISKPVSRMNAADKAAAVKEAKRGVVEALSFVSLMHVRCLRINTEESLKYADIIEKQLGVCMRMLDINRERIKERKKKNG